MLLNKADKHILLNQWIKPDHNRYWNWSQKMTTKTGELGCKKVDSVEKSG